MHAEEKAPSSLVELLAQLERDGVVGYRRYQAVRRFMNFRAREQGIPLSGVFELTPLCNLDCKMCYVHLDKNQMAGRKLLSPQQWEDLMSQAIASGMMYAKLTGGECLTYPNFQRLYLFLQSQGVETGILTNGVLLDRPMAEFLRDNPPAEIQISLYGASEEAYARVTGRRVFATVLDNIRLLQKFDLPVSIAVTPNAFMTDGEDILRLAHGLGLNARINCSLTKPREETGRALLDAKLDTYIRMYRLQRELSGGDEPNACDSDTLPEPGSISGKTPVCGVPCGAGRSGFSIGWDGIMRPCNNFFHIQADALQLGFSQAWRQIHEQALQFPRPVECNGCPYSRCCSCCVVEHASGAPIGHVDPLVCARTRRMLAEGLIHIS